MMVLDAEQLNAFIEVAKKLSFSKAAKSLALSQPALSIRVRKLEEFLQTSLFVRKNSEIELTDVGRKLFLHCQLSEEIEQEFLAELKVSRVPKSELTGHVRIAGFSTITNSVLIPSLTDFILNNPLVQLQILTLELFELSQSLKRSEAQFVITENPLDTGNIESVSLGYENNVVVEAKNIHPNKKHIYLDNDSDDQATFNFFKAQGKSVPRFERWYLDTAATILTAVEQGWGRAVQPLHIVQNNQKLQIVSDYKVVRSPVYLSYYKQPFYGKTHIAVREQLIQGFSRCLLKDQRK